jgi:hypothetical protein
LSQPSRRSPVLAGIVITLALLVSALAGPPSAVAQEDEANGGYLALGDSLPYGWDPVTPPGFAAPPSFHVGYPEVYAELADLGLTNASCPGETSGSFLDRDVPDNGCGDVLANFGLKVDWGSGSQLDYAVGFLRENPGTELVSVQLGANDLFRCQAAEAGCTPEAFGEVLGTIAANLGTTLATLRSVYHGRIAVVTYYALGYASEQDLAIAGASDQVTRGVAAAFEDVVVADGFAALAPAAARAGGSTCDAGLLLDNGDGTCDVHPTDRGHRLVAQALELALTDSYAVCPAAPAASIDATIPDDTTATHAAAITCALEYGMVQGFTDGTFRPGAPITRGQAATFVRRFIEVGSGDLLDEPGEVPFDDIEGTTHVTAISALQLAGIVDGRADATYGPGERVTRPQFAKLVLRALDHLDDPTTMGSLDLPDDVVVFDDVIGNTFQSEIQALAGAGIIQGVAPRTFGLGEVTRGQAASLFLRGAVTADADGNWMPTAAS